MKATNWEFWLDAHETSFDSPWERLFAESVLSKVEGLSPQTVRTQKPFKDLNGRERRIDFAVLDGPVRIAIEVDGWDKTGSGTGMNRREFEDFLVRQNALQASGYVVLRFSNTYFRDHPKECIDAISLTLQDVQAKTGINGADRERISPTERQLVDEVMAQNAQDLDRKLGDLGRRVGELERTSRGKWLLGASTAVVTMAVVGGVLLASGSEADHPCPDALDWRQASAHVGESATVSGPVVRTFYDQAQSERTFLDIGLEYDHPDRFQVVIFAKDRIAFEVPPEVKFNGSEVCVTGEIVRFEDGPAEIVVRSPAQIIRAAS